MGRTVCKTVPRHQRRCNKVTRYCLTGSRFAPTYRGLRPRLRPLCLVQPYRLDVTYCLLFSKMLQRICLFSVYRLAVDAEPVGWWCSRLKISELAQGFSDGCAINGSQRHLHQQQGVYLGFCESVLQQTMSVGKSTRPCCVFFLTSTEWFHW